MTDFPGALVAELAKKSGLVWVSFDGHAHPVWHAWVGDAVCLVANGEEQPLPGIEDQKTVTLLLRSKAHRHLVAEAEASVEILSTDSEHWDVVTTALKAGRLNLPDRELAVARWAVGSHIVRLVPTGTTLHTSDLPDTTGQSAPHLAVR